MFEANGDARPESNPSLVTAIQQLGSRCGAITGLDPIEWHVSGTSTEPGSHGQPDVSVLLRYRAPEGPAMVVTTSMSRNAIGTTVRRYISWWTFNVLRVRPDADAIKSILGAALRPEPSEVSVNGQQEDALRYHVRGIDLTVTLTDPVLCCIGPHSTELTWWDGVADPK